MPIDLDLKLQKEVLTICLLVVDTTWDLPGEDVVGFGRCGRAIGERQAYRVCLAVTKLGIHWEFNSKFLLLRLMKKVKVQTCI